MTLYSPLGGAGKVKGRKTNKKNICINSVCALRVVCWCSPPRPYSFRLTP